MTSAMDGGSGEGRIFDQDPPDGSAADESPQIDPLGHGHVVPVADGVAGDSREDRGEGLVGLLAGLKPDPTGGTAVPILTKLPMVPRLDPAIRREIAPELERLRWKFCKVSLPDGCYRITFDPTGFGDTFRGTVRVDRGEGSLVISGDLYRFPPTIGPIVGTRIGTTPVVSAGSFGSAVASGRFSPIFRKLGIPVYARANTTRTSRGRVPGCGRSAPWGVRARPASASRSTTTPSLRRGSSTARSRPRRGPGRSR
jgi:hypothetical protein